MIKLLPVSIRLEILFVLTVGKFIGRNFRSRSGEEIIGVIFCIDDDCTKIPNT